MDKEKRKYADRAQYLIIAVAKRRRKIKRLAVEYLGGKCMVCGYNKCVGAMDFHHRGSNRKSFGIADKGYTRSWERVKAELNDCYLLCANCHREAHAGKLQLPRVIEVEKQG